MALNKLRVMKTTLLKILLVVVMATTWQGCRISYKFNGAALDYNVYKTISVSEFPIRAALRTVDGASDLELSGEITGYNLTPQAVTEDAYASKTRLTITVRIKYTDNRVDGKNIDQSFSAYRDFDSSEMLTDVQDELCQQITKELVDLIFNATLGNW